MKRINIGSKGQVFENTLFYVFVIANLLPLLFSYYVGSLDGPKYLQIANIIKELWKGNELFSGYFELSPIYTANIFSNYSLAIMRFFLPAWLSEKMLLVFYVLLLTTGFRYLILSIVKRPGIGIFFIFPFTYTSLFLMGYYNYSIAFGFLFYAVGFYLRKSSEMNWKSTVILAILILLVYYSHFFVFGFLLTILGTLALHKILSAIYIRKTRMNDPQLTGVFRLLLASIPSLLLTIPYLKLLLIQPVSEGGNAFDPFAFLTSFRILVGFVQEEEIHLTSFLFWILSGFTIFHLGKIIYSIIRNRNSLNVIAIIESRKFVWSILVLVFFGLYIFMPNNLNGSGNILPRILILSIYLLLIWLSINKTHFTVSILILSSILYFTISLYPIHIKYRKQLDKMIIKIKNIEYLIPPNSVILSRTFLDSWNTYHFQAYIGTDKPYVNINSQAISPLFAVRWKNERPRTFLGSELTDGYSLYLNVPDAKTKAIAEYVTVVGEWGFNDLPVTDPFKTIVLRDYTKQNDENNIIVDLFKLNANRSIDSIGHELLRNENSYRKLEEKASTTHISLEDLALREALEVYKQSKQIAE